MHSKPIYYEEPYQRTLQAVVTSITEKGVVLDKTICYPEGGEARRETGALLQESPSLIPSRMMIIPSITK